MCCRSEENVKCCNCGGKHEATSLDCLTRVKEDQVDRVRANHSISYAARVFSGSKWGLGGGCDRGVAMGVANGAVTDQEFLEAFLLTTVKMLLF